MQRILSKKSGVFVSVLMLLLSLFMVNGAFAQTQETAQVRFVHVIPGASAVDVYVNGNLAISNLGFGTGSHYITVPAGNNALRVTQTGITTPLWDQTTEFRADRAYTLVASSNDPLGFTSYQEILRPLALGQARFTSIHAIKNGAAIDIVLEDGQPLTVQQEYDQSYGTLDIPAFNYNLLVVNTGDSLEAPLINLGETALSSGTSYMLVVYGNQAMPQSLLLQTPVEAEAEGGFVRFVNTLSDVASVRIADDADVTLAHLASPVNGISATGYIAVPAGTYNITVSNNDDGAAVATSALTVSEGDYLTAIIQGSADDATVLEFSDTFADANPDQALIRVFNVGTGESNISASLSDGTLIASDLAGQTVSTVTAVDASKLSLSILLPDSGPQTLPERPYYGGLLYDFIVVPELDLVAKVPDTILVSATDTFGTTQDLVTAEEPEDTTEAEPVTETETEVVEAPVAEPTAAPEPEVVQEPTAAPAAPISNVVTGRVVNLNPDANLHLRQYADSNSLSLGTIQVNTQVTVNGRQGEYANIFLSATQIPPDYVYEDPVGLLVDDKADLVREETWLYVTYDTPDGGTIDAWVRADFIDVRDAADKPVLLRDLEPVAGNTPGAAANTSIQPPAAQEKIVTVVVTNLAPTANLNVRRVPSTIGEVLVQLPLGTVVDFVGVNEARDWIFLSYTDAQGSTITGWASSAFLDYQYNGRPVEIAELEQRDLYNIVDEDQRGDKSEGAAPVVATTPDPIRNAIVATVALDPGANLNLRRQPNSNAEVMTPVPSGTDLIVNSRSGDGNWLYVTYEGFVEGWIAARTETARFVELSYNGAPYDIADVPLADGEIDTIN